MMLAERKRLAHEGDSCDGVPIVELETRCAARLIGLEPDHAFECHCHDCLHPNPWWA